MPATSPLIIRPFCDPADRAGAAKLFRLAWHAAYDTVDGHAAIERVIVSQLAEPTEGRAPEMFAMPAGDIALVALDDGGIVGSVRAHPREDGVHLSGFYVLPQRLGQGIGTALLAAIAACFPDEIRWRADVRPTSAGALRFYRRHGFTLAGHSHADVGGGHVVDVLELAARDLRASLTHAPV